MSAATTAAAAAAAAASAAGAAAEAAGHVSTVRSEAWRRLLHRRHTEKLERRHNTERGGSYFIENNYHGGTYCTGAEHTVIDSCGTEAGEL